MKKDKTKEKKNKKIIEKNFKGSDQPELSTIIKIAVGVVIFLGLVYLIGAIATGEIKLKKDTKKETTIQYSEILAEQTFKRNEKEYYVMYYEFGSNEATILEQVAASSEKTVYMVDLEKKFNANYISENITNNKPKNISELKVKNPTLIKINNKKVVTFVTGKNQIIKALS